MRQETTRTWVVTDSQEAGGRSGTCWCSARVRSCEFGSCLPGHQAAADPLSSGPTCAAGGKARVLQNSDPGPLSRLSCHLPRRPALFSSPSLPLTVAAPPPPQAGPPSPLPCPDLPCPAPVLPSLVTAGAVSLHPKPRSLPAPPAGLTALDLAGPFLMAQAWWPPGSKHPVSLRSTVTPCSPSQHPAGSSIYSPLPKLLRAPAAFTATPASLRVPRNPCSGGLLPHGCAVPLLAPFPFLHPSLYGGLLWGFAFGPNGGSLLGNPDVGLRPRPLPQNTPLPTCHLHSVWQASQMPQNPTSQL